MKLLFLLLITSQLVGQPTLSGSIAFVPTYPEAELDFKDSEEYYPVRKIYEVQTEKGNFIYYFEYVAIRKDKLPDLTNDWIQYGTSNKYKSIRSRNYPRNWLVQRWMPNPFKKR